MAEAVAIVGLAAGIIQLADSGKRVLRRLNECNSKLGDVPETFRHIKTELPLLLDALEQTRKTTVDGGLNSEQTNTAIAPVVAACVEQTKLLDQMLQKILPRSDSWGEKTKRVFKSLAQEDRVRKITADLRGYVQTLTYYHAAAVSTGIFLTHCSAFSYYVP